MIRRVALFLAVSFFLVSFYIDRSQPDGQWPVTGGSRANTRYSLLAQVDTNNVQQLQVAWVYHSESGDSTKFGPMECNPLMVDGKLYGVSSRMKLFSIDAATGQQQWQFDPVDSIAHPGWHPNSINMNRGVAYWADGEDKRIIYTVGPVVFEVNAITGKLIPSFGKNGGIDLRYGLGRPNPKQLNVAPTSPVMIYKDLFFVSGLVGDNTPGHIRGFDVRTGRQKWIFHTIPYPGELGYNTWKDKEAYKDMGSTNDWPGFSLDEKRGILFAVTGNPSNDFYGGRRLGAGLFGNCIIALDAATGKRIWHYQTVHHDVWDRDISNPPVLVTLTYKGRRVDALVQTTKQGLIFVLDRVTGRPIFPVKETPMPTNTVLKGEELWPTQPIPVMPKPFARQSLTENDLNTLVSDSSYADIKRRFRSYRKGTIFEPPTKEGTIVFPGYDGGGEWGGPAVDPATNMLYVNANEMAWVLTMIDNKIKPLAGQTNGQAGQAIYMQNCRTCHGPKREGGGDIPSLVNIDRKYTKSKFLELIAGGRKMMPSFNQFTAAQKDALASFILSNKAEQQKPYRGPTAQTKSHRPEDLFVSTGYNKFLTREGYPAISPPWGTLSAIDLNTCEYVWQIPFGEFSELKQKGIPTTGRENYGGPVVTAGGLLFIGATADGKFRAFNKRTGLVLWEADLPAPGVATPTIYSLNGKQYIVIACGGSKWGGRHSDAYVAFALPSGDEPAAQSLRPCGVALYSFNLFPFETALKKADSTGCTYVEGISWHNMGTAFGNKNLDELGPAGWQRARQLLEAQHLTMPSIFVSNGRNAAEWQQRFEMGKALGATVLTCEPERRQLDMIDSIAGVYHMQIALHEHKKGSSIYWHPDTVLAAIRGHHNIGACADIGHWARSRLNVVECLRTLRGHILELHVKDVGAGDEDADLGKGTIDFPAVIRELRRQGFTNPLYIEYEHNFENNVAAVKNECRWFNGQ